MKTLILAAAVFLMVPVLRAQQAEPKKSADQAAPQETTNPDAQNALPAAIRPGHPLDPADVDILTGKRDREMEASQRPAVSLTFGNYGYNGDVFAINGRRGMGIDLPFLPLTRIGNPYSFLSVPARGFGRGGFRGRR